MHAGTGCPVIYLVKLRRPSRATANVCTAAMALLSLALILNGATAQQLFEQGQKAERKGDVAQAYLLYSQAAAADPNNLNYWEKMQALRPIASLLQVSHPKPEELAGEPDSSLFGKISAQELERARRPLPPPELKAAAGRRDFDLRGDSKSLWEQAGKALDLNVVFDSAYQPTRPIHFELNDADYRVALRALEAATDSFLTPVSGNLILVANDTPQKRQEFERTAAVVIPFPETETVQELQEVATSVRGVLDIQRMMVDNQKKLILVRDRVTKVRLAEKLLQDLLRPRAQVAVDVEILTTDATSSLNWGLSLQNAFPLVNFPNKSNLLNVIPQGYTNFLGFGGGASVIGIGITSASLFATASKSKSSTVLDSQIVAMDGAPATLHVGDKYPLVTNTYIGDTSGGGQVYIPPPTFTFEDLGLLMKVTPHVHGPDDVTLDVNIEFKLLGAAAVNGIPVISNKQFESNVRLLGGEWAVVAGLLTTSEARTISGIPVLSLLPFMRNNTVNRDTGQTLIVLKPHVQVLPPSEYPTWRAWTGTETRFATEL
jgi:general secretion pathway protein D